MSDTLKKGDLYKGFEVLSVFDVPDFHSVAFYLRHMKTGLEVLHFLNDDPENLFGFGFKTVSMKSDGVAHIIEHSVLCGSEKYPLKDPFVILANQSVKTYLNAMTFPDKTVYPASSISRVDYFNLMDVYGDAVFFPKLQKEIFMQEAHRLEIDDSGKISIQGVVYNEMKGNYSSFDSVAYDMINMSLLKNCIYDKDSGGDPVEIPFITYEEFRAFHEKWYRPDNCLVFLYGNIPTGEQLDFLQDKFLNRLEKKFPELEISELKREKNLKELVSFLTPENFEKPSSFYYEGPSGDTEEDNVVLVSWDLGCAKNATEKLENVIVYGILANHDGSPVEKALSESDLGEDTAPQSGIGHCYHMTVTFGLRGVKAGNEKKIEKLVLDTIEKVVRDGVSKKDIETTLRALEMSNREIKRGSGPYSISIMNSILSSWTYGYGVENQIVTRDELFKLRHKIESDEKFIVNLIQKTLLENKRRALIVVRPSKEYGKKREKIESDIIARKLKETSIDEIKKSCNLLHEFQKIEDDDSCLPHLNPRDFIVDGKVEIRKNTIRIENFENADGGKNPLFVSEENTNGIIYMSLCFPVDTLDPQDYRILPALSECVTECGWGKFDYSTASEEIALHTGGLSVSLLTMESAKTELAASFMKNNGWTCRDWMIFKVKMLEEETENALKLLSDCICNVDFSDSKRIQEILNEFKNDFEASILPEGHIYVFNRAIFRNSKKNAIDEIWNGLAMLYELQHITSLPVEDVSKKFRRVFSEIKKSGAVVHLIAEKSGVAKVKECLGDFAKRTEISKIAEPRITSAGDFVKLAELESKNDTSDVEVCVAPSQVGFMAMTIPGSLFGTKEASAEEVCTHWLSNNLLWEKIRTIGGAYGAFCNNENFCSTILFSTYRDPSPFESADVIWTVLHEASETDFSKEDVEKAVVGTYSHFIQPQSPRGKGTSDFTRLLYCILDEDREKKLLEILNLTQEDFKATFRRLEKNALDSKLKDKKHVSVICDIKHVEKYKKDIDLAGKIVTLPL